MNGKPSSTNLTFDDTRHLHFHWRHCDSSRTGRCHLHWHHRGAMLHSLLQFSPEEMTYTETPKEYHFTDEQIDFLLQIVRDNAQYEEDEDREWMNELANQIEDQIVNHPTND